MALASSSTAPESVPGFSGPDVSTNKPTLLVFSDDWGRHPSSCQHLVLNLDSAIQVYWVNTIGMRPPGFNLLTVARGLGKFRQWILPRQGHDSIPANLRVLNPRMWPSFASKFARRLNRRLLVRQLTSRLLSASQPVVAVTTLPIVADILDDLPVRRWVYYCVDDFGQWPGLDQQVLKRMEEQLIGRAEVLVAASEYLQERFAGMGRSAHLLTHGVDLDFWAEAAGQDLPIRLTECERPWIVFWGLVDRRMDSDFVNRLASDLTRGTILLVGPQQDSEEMLTVSARVKCVGPVPFRVLPRLARESAVLIMPYADLAVTQAMQPLKLKEYLATGKPVVARALPATRRWRDALDLADSPAEFSTMVRQRIDTGLPSAQLQARARLVGESWKAKSWQFSEMVFGNA
jgi:glycosyltransferase involved in cell wall biosynthesis